MALIYVSFFLVYLKQTYFFTVVFLVAWIFKMKDMTTTVSGQRA